MINTFLFDLDGTLIDTPKIILETFKIIFETYFKEIKLTEKEYENFLGQTLYKTIDLYEKDSERAKEIIKQYHDISNQKIELQINPYPNALSTLKFLKKKGYKTGVVTSKLRTKATHHLTLVGLMEYVDLVVGYEDVKHHKPNPESILKAMTLLQSKPEETIYIGDHENDIKAAKNAKITSCAVSYSCRLEEMLLENPDYIIDQLNNLKDL